MMSCVVEVRRARRQDEEARTALLNRSFSDYFKDTFLYYLCQELSLQFLVLSGAILFIFVGTQAVVLLVLPPLLAVMITFGIYVMHTGLADRQRQYVRREVAGWVAEVEGDEEEGPVDIALTFIKNNDLPDHSLTRASNKQIVGTLSMTQYWQPQRSGWVQALHVAPGWQRRGVARALLEAVRETAEECHFQSLEAATSELQPAARACLHSAGWQVRVTYLRPVMLWGNVSLPTALHGLDLQRG